MPNVTVTAADTATAMDEIWDRLGPDAMIVNQEATWQNRHGSHHRINSQTGRTSTGQHSWIWNIILQSNDWQNTRREQTCPNGELGTPK